jgi:hypothetical protein
MRLPSFVIGGLFAAGTAVAVLACDDGDVRGGESGSSASGGTQTGVERTTVEQITVERTAAEAVTE